MHRQKGYNLKTVFCRLSKNAEGESFSCILNEIKDWNYCEEIKCWWKELIENFKNQIMIFLATVYNGAYLMAVIDWRESR